MAEPLEALISIIARSPGGEWRGRASKIRYVLRTLGFRVDALEVRRLLDAAESDEFVGRIREKYPVEIEVERDGRLRVLVVRKRR